MASHDTVPPDQDLSRDPSGGALNGDLYRALVEQVGEGIWLTAVDGLILTTNESACRSLGYPRDEVLGRPLSDLFHPDDMAQRPAILERLRAGELVVAERRAIRKDGVEVVLEGTSRMLPDGRLLTVTRDVTERRRIEQELRESEARLRLITDAMPALISYVDAEERYRFNNRAYDEWLGFHPAVLEGQSLREALGDAVYERIRPFIRAALAGERVAYEALLPYRSGGPRHVAGEYVPDVDEAGDVRGYYALITDISSRKEAEEALRQADRAKDEFLAILAHELRNPLAPILTASQVIKLRGPEDPVVRRQAEIIERQARHLARMVDDLLDISRVTAGKVQLRLERLAVAPLIEQAVSSTRALFEERGHTLTVQMPDPPALIDADPTRLVQILVNLLNNAARYTPPGGQVTLTAELETPESEGQPSAPGDPLPSSNANSSSSSHLEPGTWNLELPPRPAPPPTLAIRVRDTGVGIGAELMPQLFELFFQGERGLARTESGLGVGLALVKRLVEMHEGSVAAYSEGAGQGSEFLIRLPVAATSR